MTDGSIERYVAVPSDYYAHNYYAQRDAVWQWRYYWQHQAAMQEAAPRRRNTMIAAGAGAAGTGILGAGALGSDMAILLGMAAVFGVFVLGCLLFLIILI